MKQDFFTPFNGQSSAGIDQSAQSAWVRIKNKQGKNNR